MTESSTNRKRRVQRFLGFRDVGPELRSEAFSREARKMCTIKVAIGEKLLDPPEGEVVFTLNVKSGDLKYLTGTQYGRQFFLTSEKPEDMRPAYSLAGVQTVPEQVTSLAARVRGMFRNRETVNLRAYGNVILVVSSGAVIDNVVVFSADAKNLSLAAGSNRESFVAIPGSDPDLARRLNELKQNSSAMPQKSPRLRGLYFEARLLRALRPTDIQAIYLLASADPKALEQARDLVQIKAEMMRGDASAP